MIKFIKQYGTTFIMGAFLALIIFNPAAKPWILKQLVSIGFFKAEIVKKENLKNLPSIENFSFTDSNGKLLSISTLKGKIVFINFWASWCPPCGAEMPSINNLFLKFQNDKRITFLFFNEDDDKEKAFSFLRKNKFSMPLVYRSGNIPAELFSGSLPTTIILNKQGKIVYKNVGMAGYDTEEFIKDLNKLL